MNVELGGRPGLPVPNSPYGLCGRKATLNSKYELSVTNFSVVRSPKRNCQVAEFSETYEDKHIYFMHLCIYYE